MGLIPVVARPSSCSEPMSWDVQTGGNARRSGLRDSLRGAERSQVFGSALVGNGIEPSPALLVSSPTVRSETKHSRQAFEITIGVYDFKFWGSLIGGRLCYAPHWDKLSQLRQRRGRPSRRFGMHPPGDGARSCLLGTENIELRRIR